MTNPLEKFIWTDADYEQMCWHDVVVHGILVHPEKWEILFDIDYIVKWFSPEPPEKYFKYLVSPATLIFDGVNSLELNYSYTVQPIQILSIDRDNPRKIPGRDLTEWEWVFHLVEGGIQFKSYRFTQYIRRAPFKGNGYLEIDKRGGICFDKVTESK
jgi:hypothetical protein